MGKLQEVKDQLFLECQDILRKISTIDNAEALVANQDLFYTVTEKIAVLKAIADDKLPITDKALQEIENKTFNQEINEDNTTYFEEDNFPEFLVNNVNEDNNSYIPEAELESEPVSETTQEAAILEDEKADIPVITDEGLEEELISEALLSEEAYERNVEVLDRQPETEPQAEVPNLRVIHETEPHQQSTGTKEEEEMAEERRQHEKKIKLASIKALNKNLHSLFDDDALEAPQVQPQRTLHSANMPTEYMEAPKAKPDFKLDLNDRIAFTQKLFGGSQTELNKVIQHLNSFSSLEEAKVYLSDLYYEKNWKKVDDYAQRLWMLVENKFL